MCCYNVTRRTKATTTTNTTMTAYMMLAMIVQRTHAFSSSTTLSNNVQIRRQPIHSIQTLWMSPPSPSSSSSSSSFSSSVNNTTDENPNKQSIVNGEISSDGVSSDDPDKDDGPETLLLEDDVNQRLLYDVVDDSVVDEITEEVKAALVESNSNIKDGNQFNDMKAQSASIQTPIPTATIMTKKKFRMQLFAFLNKPIVEVLAALAVLLSSLLVALSTLNDLSPASYTLISWTLFGLDISFAIDFFARWYAAGQFKLRYLTKPLAVIDIIVVILPLCIASIMPVMDTIQVFDFNDMFHDTDKIIQSTAASVPTLLSSVKNPIMDSAGLQNLLLLRVLRLRRVLTDINTFGRFTSAMGIKGEGGTNDAIVRPYQLQLARVLLSIFTLLSVATGLIYSAEHNVNPDIPDYFTALYFGLTTLTTVGFGDITPVTPTGRFVVSASILAGIAIIPAQAAKLVEALLELQRDQETGVGPAKKRKQQRRVYDATTIRNKAGGIADGKGPSGIQIEIPPIEKLSSSKSRASATTMIISKPCISCGESSHRNDANYCWSCGTELTK